MSRRERRALAVETRKQAMAWPERLTEVPENEWPRRRPEVQGVWRSRHFLVVQWPSPPLNGIEVRRLSVNRVTARADGHWDQDISWEDLMRCKRETGHGDWYATEIYPRDRDIVNVANMRHLWLLTEPLALGWFQKDST